SLARMLAERVEGGWHAPLPSGRVFGEALLDASVQYASLVAALLDQALPVTYMSHITGHGLRKLMRADHELTYVIDTLPEVPEVLAFMVQQLGIDAAEAYGTFNMGAGFAVYSRPGSGAAVVAAAEAVGLTAQLAGRVEAGPRRVVLEPLGVTYGSDDLAVR
ncbi:MAG TPA: AIR synthase-related protein, partial [Conexibacter sp.]